MFSFFRGTRWIVTCSNAIKIAPTKQIFSLWSGIASETGRPNINKGKENCYSTNVELSPLFGRWMRVREKNINVCMYLMAFELSSFKWLLWSRETLTTSATSRSGLKSLEHLNFYRLKNTGHWSDPLQVLRASDECVLADLRYVPHKGGNSICKTVTMLNMRRSRWIVIPLI